MRRIPVAPFFFQSISFDCFTNPITFHFISVYLLFSIYIFNKRMKKDFSLNSNQNYFVSDAISLNLPLPSYVLNFQLNLFVT